MKKSFENKEIHSYSIDIAEPKDAAGIAEVQEQTWIATYPNEQHGITEEDIRSKNFLGQEKIDKWTKSIENQNEQNHTFIAKEGDKIVGFCVVHKEDEHNVLNALYILPELQGQGLGKELLLKGLDWLGEDKDIILDVASYNTIAIEFYKKMGFEEWREEDPSLATKLPSGNIIPGLEMIKRVKLE